MFEVGSSNYYHHNLLHFYKISISTMNNALLIIFVYLPNNTYHLLDINTLIF
ncbi:hypothetical protein HMPREF3226_00495 [Prevotella corporis]|uniref:Uncharacterized protein n=1 Tax=Prevotella corporis TaxID=28128 RepID=A0A133QJV9_9BACT|nr:hypothetical protein HMPREF3226_00495 [Prevotella corporis]